MNKKIGKICFAAACLLTAAAVFLAGCAREAENADETEPSAPGLNAEGAGRSEGMDAEDLRNAEGTGTEQASDAETVPSGGASAADPSADASVPDTSVAPAPDTSAAAPIPDMSASPASDTSAAPPAEGANDITICIDPGHYEGSSILTGENIYGYTEGAFTLRLALKLKQILKDRYGIDCILTRETGSITLGGYTDRQLDSGHISLRGEFARGCDYFISLHTNANEENANGFPTCNQPSSITKTIVIVNQPALQSETALRMAESIGRNLSRLNYQLGLSVTDEFTGASSGEPVIEWTKERNDQLDAGGFLCQRLGSRGDYYGVLRGAANVNVPGMIVEHGFHTVAGMRRLAMEEDLCAQWADADARGIAEALGLTDLTDPTDR